MRFGGLTIIVMLVGALGACTGFVYLWAGVAGCCGDGCRRMGLALRPAIA